MGGDGKTSKVTWWRYICKVTWWRYNMLLRRVTSKQGNRKDFESWRPKCRFKQKSCSSVANHIVNHPGDRGPDALPDLYGAKEKHDIPMWAQRVRGVHHASGQMSHVQKTCWQTTHQAVQLLKNVTCASVQKNYVHCACKCNCWRMSHVQFLTNFTCVKNGW